MMVAALVVCAWAGSARAEDWGTPGLDAAHSRLSAERSGASFGRSRWSTSLKNMDRVLASPVVADGFLVTVDLMGLVSALGAEDGTPLWQAAAGAAVHGTPTISRGRVFVPTFGEVVALRIGDGSVAWRSNVGGAVLSSPAPIDRDIIVAAGFPEHHVLRLSGETGAVLWQSPDVMQQFSNTSPAVGGGLAVVGSNGGRYYAFDVETGAPRWDYVADGLVNLAAPVIAGGRVFMAGGNDSNRVHSVDAETGAPSPGWPVELPTPAPDIAGTVVGRHRAISSFASVAGLLFVQTRVDDALDTNGDGAVDGFLSRETVVALDAVNGQQVWQAARGRTLVADGNDVPKFLVCPTPAAYGTDGASALIVSASTLEASIVTLDAVTGSERSRTQTTGPALASPLLANGWLYAAAANGTIEGLGSTANRAPGTAIPARTVRAMDAAALTLHWLPAIDPDGDLPSYELRIDSDGEVLESWQQQLILAPGSTSVPITGPLQPGVTYTYALRARDPQGALSAWSDLQTFTVFKNPPVSVGGTPANSLTAAIAGALPGSIISLDAGTYTLAQTLTVRGGVSIQGAGAGRTILDGTGLAVGISFEGTDTANRTTVDGLTVTGADTCARVGDGSAGVRLTHVIARDCRTNGVAIEPTGEVTIVNATLVGNGTGVRAAGSTRIRNSLLTGNAVGLASITDGALASTYNDVFGNQTGYTGAQPGTGDFATAVTFPDLAGRSLRLLTAQPSTDRGDPADPVGDEPSPNGGRINLGAFGGTADAEASATSTAIGATGPGADPTADPAPPGLTPGNGTEPRDDGGCAVSGRLVHGWLALWPLLALLAGRRRPKR